MEWLKCIIKCLFQFIFKFGEFVYYSFAYFLNYWLFCDFDPFTGHFWGLGCHFELFEAKLKYFGHYGVLEIY